MATRTTFNMKGQPYCTVDILPLTREVLERASASLRKEHGRKFLPGEMDFDELAEFSAECTRLVVEQLEMADGTRPLSGKDPKVARRWFREEGERRPLSDAITRIAKRLADENESEIEETSGN